jgi:hypothetical protein
MRKVRAFGLRILGLFNGRRSDDDFSAELESHIALHTDDDIRAGLTPEEARRQALLRLGGAEQTRQAHRQRRTLPWLDSLLQTRVMASARCAEVPVSPSPRCSRLPSASALVLPSSAW